jgi:hypothetical protein
VEQARRARAGQEPTHHSSTSRRRDSVINVPHASHSLT